MQVENDLIAALATPFGASALAVVRTAGERCVDSVADLTDRPEAIRMSPGGRLRRAFLRDPREERVIDDVMLGVYRAPRSYTGDDSVEIYCHGSVAGIREILDLLHRNGFRMAEPGEFTMRAFLAGKVDLTRAEAVGEIVRSRTAHGHDLALRRLGGSVEQVVNGYKRELVGLMARVAVQLDYPEEETGELPIPLDTVQRLRDRLQQLAGSYRTGRLYQEGVRIALAGRTNAGKSSLFNAFLKEDRSIVSETHGTTRDYIESSVDLGGIPVTIFDTAGLRTTAEKIEEEGIKRTGQVLETADLVLYLVDGIEGFGEDERSVLESRIASASADHRIIMLWNKIDDPRCLPAPEKFRSISATTMEGMDTLIEVILTRVTPADRYTEGIPVIDSLRQKNLVERAAAALGEVEDGVRQGIPVDAISLDLQDAIQALGEITGEVTSADILDAVFSGFCVGK